MVKERVMSDINKLFEHAPEGAVDLRKTDLYGCLQWFNDENQWWDSRDKTWNNSHLKHTTIATRPEPRKTVADAVEAKSEPKWTYKTKSGYTCRIIHENEGHAWIKYKDLPSNLIVPMSDLKPIKPTITESQAWQLVSDNGAIPSFIERNYNVVKD
jgi:hypothetical protein